MAETYSAARAMIQPCIKHTHFRSAASRNNLAQAAAPTPAPCQSPTAVIGGSNFNSSMARLAGQASQRKRINSIDDLQSLR